MFSVRNHATITALAFLVSGASLFAQPSSSPVSIDPPDPTSVDSVTLLVQQFDSCPPPPTVTRSGFDINVTVNAGLCVSPPGLITHSIDLGTLPAGSYNVNVVYPGSSVPVTFAFVVLDANATVAVSQSIGSTAGGTAVNIVIAAAHCLNQPPASCPPPSITFGGVPAPGSVGSRVPRCHGLSSIRESGIADPGLRTALGLRHHHEQRNAARDRRLAALIDSGAVPPAPGTCTLA